MPHNQATFANLALRLSFLPPGDPAGSKINLACPGLLNGLLRHFFLSLMRAAPIRQRAENLPQSQALFGGAAAIGKARHFHHANGTIKSHCNNIAGADGMAGLLDSTAIDSNVPGLGESSRGRTRSDNTRVP
jgi:hypothetical protein